MSEIADIEHAPAGFSPEVQSAAQLAEVLVTAVNGAIDAGTKAVEALTALAYVAAELIASPPGKPWRDLRRSQRQYFDDSLGWYLAEIARQRARGPAP